MKKLGYISAAFLLPAFAFAYSISDANSLGSAITQIINNIAIPLIFAIAFVVFIWGVFQYFILGGHDEEKRETGKSLMLWGLIGFFVMVSVWGLVHILTGTFSLSNNTQSASDLPTAPSTR